MGDRYDYQQQEAELEREAEICAHLQVVEEKCGEQVALALASASGLYVEYCKHTNRSN